MPLFVLGARRRKDAIVPGSASRFKDGRPLRALHGYAERFWRQLKTPNSPIAVQ